MPAKSKTQQSLMGMALAYKRGQLDTSKISKNTLAHIRRMASTMTEEQLSDYASTPRKRLPRHKGTPQRIRRARQ